MSSGRKSRCAGPAVAAFAAAAIGFFAVPAIASAAPYYVAPGGDDTGNNCTNSSLPCATIAHAVSSAQDSEGNQVLLADGTYDQSFTLTAGLVLSSSDGDVGQKPVVNGQVTIDDDGGSIDHLELKGTTSPILSITGPATISANAFTETALPGLGSDISIAGEDAGDAVVISGNTFTDDGAGTQAAIVRPAGAGDVSILDNTISGFYRGYFAQGATAPVIRRNTITGTHSNGSGIELYAGLGAVITDNRLGSPAPNAATGIFVTNVSSAVSATLERNQVIGPFSDGIDVTNTTSFTLDGDLVAGAVTFGLATFDLDAGEVGDISATNVTIVDAGFADLHTDGALITLNSAITGAVDISNAGTCAISFSRGDVVGGAPTNDCDDFQRADDPLLTGDYHLQAGSPMIDAGDPAAPALGALDLDGGLRGISGAPGCTPAAGRRDIGADEFVPPPSGCPVPPGGSTTQAKKKCKKGRKLKKGKCVKKKRKKK